MTKKIEQLSRIVEYCLDKIVDTECTDERYLEKYHIFHDMLCKELDKDLAINTTELNISEFMHHIVEYYIKDCLDYRKKYYTFGDNKKYYSYGAN
jgi:hypothetical protein